MTGYSINRDEARGFTVCRISGTMTEDQVSMLCVDLGRELAFASARGPLRLLWDHRGLPVIVDDRADRLLAVWRQHCREGDRIAILVSTSLDKVLGKPKTAEEAAFFMSENAAHMWLGVGAVQAA